MKKIAIIGLPGSGKSTFASHLGQKLGLPVYHLDKLCFNGLTKVDHNKFVADQQKLVNKDFWIIEGCSIKTLELRFSTADTVIYLDFPRLQCLWRVIKRAMTKRDPICTDSGCANFINRELFQYIWNFKKEKSERIEELRKLYPNLKFILIHSSKELEQYLKASQA